jgi:hypothetical protein
MENKYRKTLARAYKIISPDLDSSKWNDQEFVSIFANDMNYQLDHMMKRSKYIEELNAKHNPVPTVEVVNVEANSI